MSRLIHDYTRPARETIVNTSELNKILERVRAGRVSPDEALRRLKTLPYEDLGFAKVDNHRQLRRGFPEVIFGEGKSVPQIVAIMGRVASKRQPVLVTRVPPEVYRRRSEEHTSELQSPYDLVCRLLLEKKK